jgi:hypothetical protein
MALRQAALKREQLRKSSTRSSPQGMKAGCRQNQKRQGHHGVEVPFTRSITELAGMPFLGEEMMVHL